jgi:PadR family transcriptional regulator PadR
MIAGLMQDPVVREFLLAFWKIHILHHAAEQGVYGQWMLEELHRHGYRLSPGTLYPILSRMSRRGWLRAAEPERANGPRVYRLTPQGHAVLDRVRGALDELYGEAGRLRATHRRARTTGAKSRPPATSRSRRQPPR